MSLLCLAACDSRPSFSQQDLDGAKLGEGLPANFLLGASSSAFQTEGGLDNNWTDWELATWPDGTPHIKNGDRAGRAADSWNLWPDDVAALEKLGANSYRLSLEWSRLQPNEGEWDEAAAAHYREVLKGLRAKGINPFVTLYHFALPRWFAAKGGWEWDGAQAAFESYSEHAALAFGDLVDDWTTVNEMNVVVVEGYLSGRMPPGVQDAKRAVRVYATLLKAHAASVGALRRLDTTDADGDGRATWVGIAHYVQIFQAASAASLDPFIAGQSDDFTNEVPLRAAKTGRIQIVFPGEIEIDEAFEGLKGSFDYLGINFYARTFVRADLADPALAKHYVPEGRPTNDAGLDLYPEGFYRVLKRYAAWGWPVVVLENGVSDADDSLRPQYLRAHLYALQRAVAEGADIRGYHHWSLTDNFELTEGFSSRFGLFAVDFTDPALKRTARPSVQVFREAARGLGLTPAP
jgi:beta-glucosidase